MSESSSANGIDGLAFEEIEAAVMQSDRGRWFLNEFARRNKSADTIVLLDALRKLENQLTQLPAAASTSAAPSRLAEKALSDIAGLFGLDEAASNDDQPRPNTMRELTSRLADITMKLRKAVDRPEADVAKAVKPQIDRLEDCVGDQKQLAGKLARTIAFVNEMKQGARHATPSPGTPAFVPSDDDLFVDAPRLTGRITRAPAASKADRSQPQPQKPLTITASQAVDTLEFVDDLPAPPTGHEDDVGANGKFDGKPAAKSGEGKADKAAAGADTPDSTPPASPETPAPSAGDTEKADGKGEAAASAKSSRIVVVRRPAEEMDTIPLAEAGAAVENAGAEPQSGTSDSKQT